MLKDQGHKRKCSPKKKKKRSSQKFFKQSPQKNVFQKFFLALHEILTIQKIVLSSSQGQASFRGLEAKAKDLTFEAKDFKMCPRGRPLISTYTFSSIDFFFLFSFFAF